MRLVACVAVAALACGGTPRRRGPLLPLSRDGYAHYLAGKLALVDGDVVEAVAQLSLAAAAQPDEPQIAVALARARLRANDVRGALATATRATDRWPRVASTWRVRGEAAQAADDLPLATTAFDRAIQLAPDDEATYLALATVWTARARADLADATLRRLLVALPASVEANWRLAAAAEGAGQLADADRYLHAVLDAEPDHLDARAALAQVLRARGDLVGAVAQSRQAFDRSGQHPALGEALVWMLCEHGDRQGALDVAALLDDDEASAATLLQVARIQLTLGALPAAQLAAAAAARVATDDRHLADAAVRTQAMAAHAAGDLPGAQALVVQIADRDPGAVALQVEWMIDADQIDAALALATTAHARHATSPLAALALARAEQAHGDGATSGAALHALATAAPADRDVQLAWATYLDERGASDRAADVLAPFVAAAPDDAGLQNTYGYVLAKAGTNLATAARALQRARALAPGDPAVLDSWGWLRLRQGKVGLALRALRRAADLAPHEAELRAHLAEALAVAGEVAASQRAWRRAAALAPPGATRRRIEARAAQATAAPR